LQSCAAHFGAILTFSRNCAVFVVELYFRATFSFEAAWIMHTLLL